MDIIPIFGQNLFAFKYTGEGQDEFHRLFSLWNDPEFLEGFFEENIDDITDGFYGTFTVEGAIFETYDSAIFFETQINELATRGNYYQLKGLDAIFKPLHNSQTRVLALNESKARQDWLRLYALRIDKDVYIITGGTIKLTKTMQERDHTKQELAKIRKCREYLVNSGISDIDGVIEEMEI
ncbi:MAG: hypothetical protein R6U85_10025 [Salinivirgaceae bacterium]